MNAIRRRGCMAALAVPLAVLGAVAPVPDAAGQARFDHRISDQEFNRRVRRADPSKVIAAELAFARMAQEEGQWTAFAEFAADDAVMFVPEPVDAREWLRKQPNPAQAVRWQPHRVWSSCDGTLALIKGGWERPDGSAGYFTTVWQRTRKGEYRWVMDQGDALAQPLAAPDMIGATVADCSRPAADPLSVASGEVRGGQSRDGTLHWQVVAQPDGSRAVTAVYWNGTGWSDAVREQVAAP